MGVRIDCQEKRSTCISLCEGEADHVVTEGSKKIERGQKKQQNQSATRSSFVDDSPLAATVSHTAV